MTFTKKKENSLTGLTEIRFIQDETKDTSFPFHIVADKQGVHFCGESTVIESREQLESLAEAVGWAWGEHLKMKPKFVKTLAGH